ncbi:MBL fold metallo-hydrolase [Bailinhaonella thermotolerans]|uniref:MBL fold metallo-hydrolase n=1 Tax=Bailinhaonella thermotolerans TaxID=1070861 RepID=A0A3A4AVD3_9ACTN|nr:MBL fold metallo-hydrolase [Bailinhaonella thermotolerans]RJL33575.1 MBL fold metallo-hydrolase [Bailinhaonella thermotolerans]
MSDAITRVVTSGRFTLDGGTWDVDNNVWLVGDGAEVLVIDAAHSAPVILEAVAERRVTAIVCTHAHNDHINAAAELSRATGAPIWLHPADTPLWEMEYGGRRPDAALSDGDVLTAGGVELRVIHTPGHAPGAVSLYAPDLGAVFTGDTLFNGGPGATGRSFSDFPTIVASIRDRLLTLPPETVVHTGHGDDTTIGAEAPHLDDWIRRGH